MGSLYADAIPFVTRKWVCLWTSFSHFFFQLNELTNGWLTRSIERSTDAATHVTAAAVAKWFRPRKSQDAPPNGPGRLMV